MLSRSSKPEVTREDLVQVYEQMREGLEREQKVAALIVDLIDEIEKIDKRVVALETALLGRKSVL